MPGQKTDHELILQIHDDVQELKPFVDMVTRTLWGHDGESMGLVARVTVNERDAEKNDMRICEIEKLAPAMKAVIWIGAAVGISFIGLIVSLITGQVTMVFGG